METHTKARHKNIFKKVKLIVDTGQKEAYLIRMKGRERERQSPFRDNNPQGEPKMAKQIITPATQTTTTTTAAQAYAQAYALALTAVRARKAAETAAKQAQEMKEEEQEAKRMIKGMTQTQNTHAPITLDEMDDTPATTNSVNAAQWIIAASLASLAILTLILIITISIH